MQIFHNFFFTSLDGIDTKIGLGVPSSFFLPMRFVLEISLMPMLVLTSSWQISMKTLVSSSFVMFF